jgi:predicted ATPase
MPENPIFVGQEKELECLFRALDRVSAGRSQITFVTGEAGAGKSRLVEEFLNQASDKYKVIYLGQGRCYPYTSKIGYFPFQKAFEDLLSEKKGAKRLTELVNKVAKFTWSYAPDLVGVLLPGASPVVKTLEEVAEKSFGVKIGETSRFSSPLDKDKRDTYQIWSQFQRLMENLSSEHPLIIFIDDLHWADEETLGLLAFLGQNLEGKVMLLATYRPHDVNLGRGDAEHPLLQVRRDLLKAQELQELSVSALSVSRYVAENYTPNAFPPEFVRQLEKRTEGNAFFLVQLLTDLEDQAKLKQCNSQWCLADDWECELPSTIQAVLTERLSAERIGADNLGILTTASVEGVEFIAQIVGQVQKLDEIKLTTCLTQELDRRHQVVQFSEERELGISILDIFQFRHSFFQRFLYENLSKPERRLLHRTIGVALEDLFGEQVGRIAIDLARHFKEGQSWEGLSKYGLMAAQQQLGAYSFTEAKRWCELAYNAVCKLPESQKEIQERKVNILLEWGRVEASLTGMSEAIRRYREAEANLQGQEDSIVSRAYFLLAKALYGQKRYSEAIEYFNKSLELRKKTKNASGCVEILAAAKPLYRRKVDLTYEEFLSVCNNVMAISEETTNVAATIDILKLIGNVFEDQGQTQDAIEKWEIGLREARKVGDRKREAKMLRRVGRGLRLNRQLEESVRMYEESRKISRELGDIIGEADALGGLALSTKYMGQVERSLAYREEHLALMRQTGDPARIANSLNKVGLALSKFGRKREALEKYRESLKIRERYGYTRVLETSMNNVAAIAKHLGYFDEALSIFEQLLEEGCKARDLHRMAISLNHVGDILRIQGKYGEALAKHREALSLITSPMYTEQTLSEGQNVQDEVEGEEEDSKYANRKALTLRFLGKVFFDLGQYNDAVSFFRQSYEHYEKAGLKPGAARSRCFMELAFIAQDYSRGTHISLLIEITEQLEQLGDQVHQAIARQGLAIAYLSRGDTSEALDQAFRAARLFKEVESYHLADAQFTVAKILLARNNNSGALKWLNLARKGFIRLELKHRLQEVEAIEKQIV